MAVRAMWKAELELDQIRLPVKLFAALQDTNVHFRLLHARDHRPIQQQMVDQQSQQPVPREQLRRAVQVKPGTFVKISDEERAGLEPAASRTVSVERVLSADRIDLNWFDRPYFLGPDGGEEQYFAIAQVLTKRGWVGIAHWVMRKRRYWGALLARDGYLMLQTLRHAEDQIQLGALRPPKSREPDKRETKLAEQLVATLEDSFDPAAYHDEHREQVLELLEAKASGKLVRFPKAAKREKPQSLMEDLQASLQTKRGERKAGGKRG